MQKKQEKPNAQQLWDQPVPPVKGAVTDWQDAVLRPDRATAQRSLEQLQNPVDSGSWL